ncbi:MAG: type I restriction endonuclease subunit R [Ignavibacteriaceae bacterium]|nr:type I restriction endonuclease subunit R [Ignavibacteriaceae bacterium]
MTTPTEKRFETHIENSLNSQGYTSIPYTKYDKALCLVPDGVIEFITSTQRKEWEKLEQQYGTSTSSKVLSRISDEIGKKGIVDVLRNGVKDRGANLRLIYFQPNSGLNKEHEDLYRQNKLSLIRQLRYSTKNEKSIDMVLFVNGLPILTMELKNKLTGQNYRDSEKQYKTDRDPAEPLLKFKRCVVHFCVDDDSVSMTTQLAGDKTRFLPYNKDIENPVEYTGYRTHYLWEEVLAPGSLCDILENFVHIAKEASTEWDSVRGKVIEKTKELLVFPRYHQLAVIRKLKNTIKEEGPGYNYLIQHTTGAGKSYTIGWLAHLLTSLYKTKNDTKRIFDSIVVVTDRIVLDRQLQNTIKQLEQTQGVVNKVEAGSQQLKLFLQGGKDIIITTIQKFPFISEEITKMGNKTFGVIIDEVHSSQSGESAKHLKKTLSATDDNNGEDEIDVEDKIIKEIKSRGKQKHISFFGFTGTPKNKTLELFGRKRADGMFEAFHYYTMRQSIYERFTLDVIQNYTTYKRWFKVIQKNSEDKKLPEGEASRALINFADSHEETIHRKVMIILDQFRYKTEKTIGGRGRAMVVVRSRLHCVLFFKEMVKQMKELALPYSCLVAFSGIVESNGQEYSEDSLNKENGLSYGVTIEKGLKDPRFRLLIVSNKFQTGYDEPLLHSMFIDKVLDGIQCVQTLSRLNRVTTGKTGTFVLDFVNEYEKIIESFEPFYTTTLLSEETDPNKLYDIESNINSYNLFTKTEIDEFCFEFYTESKTDEQLQPLINRVVDRWKEIEDIEIRNNFKSEIQSYIRLYGYISQIIDFVDVSMEKLFIFLKYLNQKLPKYHYTGIDLSDSVDLESLRIQILREHHSSFEGRPGILNPITAEAGQKKEEPQELLSEIIKKINEVFGEQLNDEHRIMIQHVNERIHKHEGLQKVMAGDNTEQNKKKKFEEVLDETLLSYVNTQFDFYKKLEDPKIKEILINVIFRNYGRSAGV